MLLSLLIRTWRRHWTSFLMWTSFCLLLGIYNLVLYPYFINLPEYSTYLLSLPQWLLFLDGQPGQLDASTSFLFLSTLSFTAPFLWLVLIIKIGLNETAGEEETGSLIFFLSHPIRRGSLFLAKAMAVFFLTLIMGLILWGSLAAIITLVKMPVALDWLAWVVLNDGLFVLWGGALAMLLGALTGKEDLSALLMGIIMLLMWLAEGLTRLGMINPMMRWFNPWGLISMSITEKNAITPWVWAGMVALGVITFAGGTVAWRLRNFSRLSE